MCATRELTSLQVTFTTIILVPDGGASAAVIIPVFLVRRNGVCERAGTRNLASSSMIILVDCRSAVGCRRLPSDSFRQIPRREKRLLGGSSLVCRIISPMYTTRHLHRLGDLHEQSASLYQTAGPFSCIVPTFPMRRIGICGST
ncbi:hypothetical protein ARMSODRAFT_620045 [Armillaria solidipes]|uniref:Uncharacterized protein n=1 Tax=Armillaria solidipes TaxID=1076256 RepID=A0A2H3B6W1_9AGAR|nr:hypothetical protein ARMSODRAFT_620045 [Armillaria solidipes]